MAMISDTRFRLFVAMTIVVAALVTYSSSFTNGFVWDDASSVLIHEDVKNGQIAELFAKDQHAFGRGQGNFYRPLVSVSFAIDYALTTYGTEPALNSFGVPDISPLFFHLTNTLWHAAAAVFLFLVLAECRAPRLVQVAVALLYVVHPLHTEAVTYISGRADPMAATFGFAGLLLVLRSASGTRGLVTALGATLCFALALLCKESALIFPFLALALLLTFRRSEPGRAEESRAKFPVTVVAGSAIVLLAYGALRATALNFGTDSTASDKGLGHRMLETLQAFALYIKLTFVPSNLHMERTLNGIGTGTAILGALAFVACIGVAIVAYRSRQPRLLAAVIWFLLTWLPISGIFPLNAPMAEHWMYVPLAGFLWAVFEIVGFAANRKGIRTSVIVVAYAAGLCFVTLTVLRNLDWRDNESIYRATLRDNPGSIRVTYNLAVTYEDLLDNMPGARRSYERVIELYQVKKHDELAAGGEERFWDDELESHLSLGRIFMTQQRFDQAAQHFATLLRVSPTDSTRPLIETAAVGMVQSVLAMGRTSDAKRIADQLREKFPEVAGQLDALVSGISA